MAHRVFAVVSCYGDNDDDVVSGGSSCKRNLFTEEFDNNYLTSIFFDAIASPSTYPCQWVSGSVIDSFRLNIAVASLSFASLFLDEASKIFLVVCSVPDGVRGWAYSK